MKKNVLTVLLAFLSASVFSQIKMPPLKISHLSGNFYVYESYGKYGKKIIGANAMYLVTKNGVILFDTPWDSTYYQPLLDSIQEKYHKKILMCIATHFHADRTGALEYYRSKGIKTYTTKTTDSLSLIHRDKCAEFLIPNDTVFNLYGYQFQTNYPGGGHTLDNIVIWFPKEKILYGGCLIKSVNAKDLGNLEDAKPDEWASSIRNLQSKLPHLDYIITGHDDWKNKNSLQHTLDLIAAYQMKQHAIKSQ